MLSLTFFFDNSILRKSGNISSLLIVLHDCFLSISKSGNSYLFLWMLPQTLSQMDMYYYWCPIKKSHRSIGYFLEHSSIIPLILIPLHLPPHLFLNYNLHPSIFLCLFLNNFVWIFRRVCSLFPSDQVGH